MIGRILRPTIAGLRHTVVEPDGVADDFRWKSIAVVAWGIGLHWTILSVTSSI